MWSDINSNTRNNITTPNGDEACNNKDALVEDSSQGEAVQQPQMQQSKTRQSNTKKLDEMTSKDQARSSSSIDLNTTATKEALANPEAGMIRSENRDIDNIETSSNNSMEPSNGPREGMIAKQTWAVEVEKHDSNKEKITHKKAVEELQEVREEVNHYSGKFQALQEVNTEEDSEDEEPQNKDMDTSKIFWFSEDKAFAHSSGMRYELGTKEYTTWVTDDPDDLRCLYYLPFQGVLKLVRTGKRGKLNNLVLKDNDWDKSRIYTEKSIGYRHDLHQLFREKIEENAKQLDN